MNASQCKFSQRGKQRCVSVSRGVGVWGLGEVMLIFRINCVLVPVTVTPPEVGQPGSDNKLKQEAQHELSINF